MKTEFNKIKKLIKKNNYKKAYSLLYNKETKRINPPFNQDLYTSWYLIGEVYYQQEKLSKALNAFKKSIKHKKKNLDSNWMIGNCYLNLNKPKLAERYYIKAMRLSKNDPLLLSDIGDAFYDQKEYPEAIKYYLKSLKYNGLNSELKKTIGGNILRAKIINLISRKDYKKALSKIFDLSGNIEKIFRGDSYSAWQAWHLAGDIYIKIGDLPSAIKAFKKSLDYRKKNVNSLWDIGNCYSDLGRPKMAERYFTKALSLVKNDPKLIYNLGNSLFDQGKYTEALNHYKKVLKLSEDRSIINKLSKKNIKNIEHIIKTKN